MRHLAFFALIISLIFSCENPVVKGKTENGGFEYIHHIANDGPKPKGGEIVVFHYELRNSTEVLYDTRSKNKPLEMTFPSEGGTYNKPLPFVEGTRIMSEGDSLTIFFPVGDNPPKDWDGSLHIIYDIKVESISAAKSGDSKE